MEINIDFVKSNKIVRVYPGNTLLSIARENKIRIPSPCGGNGLCGGCKVVISKGSDFLDVSAEEYDRLSEEEINANYRLSCAYIVSKDIKVEA